MQKPPLSKLTVYLHGSEQKVGPCCDSHKTAVILCRKLFPGLANATRVGFYAMDLAVSKSCPVELCEDAWDDVTASAHVKKMVVTVVDQSSKLERIQHCMDASMRRSTADIKTMTGKIVSIEADAHFKVADLKEQIQRLDGTPVHLQQRIYLRWKHMKHSE